MTDRKESWIRSAEDDLDAAIILIDHDKHEQALIFLNLSVIKMLNALFGPAPGNSESETPARSRNSVILHTENTIKLVSELSSLCKGESGLSINPSGNKSYIRLRNSRIEELLDMLRRQMSR